MNKKLTLLVLSLMAISVMARADDATKSNVTNAVEHPETAYHEHEMKADSTDAQELSQQQKEVKAKLNQAKTDYEKSLAANGADSDVTKEAKKRYTAARHEYKKLAMKTSKADQDVKEDAQKVSQDKAVN